MNKIAPQQQAQEERTLSSIFSRGWQHPMLANTTPGCVGRPDRCPGGPGIMGNLAQQFAVCCQSSQPMLFHVKMVLGRMRHGRDLPNGAGDCEAEIDSVNRCDISYPCSASFSYTHSGPKISLLSTFRKTLTHIHSHSFQQTQTHIF